MLNSARAEPNTPDRIPAMQVLALMAMTSGNYESASSTLVEILNLLDKTKSIIHPEVASIRNLVALTGLAQGQREVVTETNRIYWTLDWIRLLDVLDNSSEAACLSYLGTVNPYDLPGSLESGPDAAAAAIAFKGIVLDRLINNRFEAFASKDPIMGARLIRLREMRQKLVAALVASNVHGMDTSDEALPLKGAIEKEERALAQDLRGIEKSYGNPVLVADAVAMNLPSDMALVEYFRYNRYLGKFDWEASFGAAIIRRDSAPVFVCCGTAERIENAVKEYLVAIEGIATGQANEALIEAKSRELYGDLIAKLVPHLKGFRKLILCPDGVLHFLPFATLLDEKNRFLAETASLYHVASGRDLVPKTGPIAKVSPPLVAGNPLFTLDASESKALAEVTRDSYGATLSTALRSGLGSDFSGIEFPPLLGTRDEARQVSAALDTFSAVFGKSTILTEGEVTEPALRRLQSPKVLHLATHGFFLNESRVESGAPGNPSPRAAGRPRESQNPLFRSGIALTGAQNTIRAWARGEVPNPDNDGILLAAEVGDLNLLGTELVTLSACKTALGDVVSGEGILGMRRAFVMAGARNVLMTLWDIADEPTAGFMGDFYRRYGETNNAPEALWAVQRDALVRLRKEEGLAVAVYLAGPFVMSAQARRLPPSTRTFHLSPRTGPALARSAAPFTNSLGMKFVLVPGTDALFSVWETRVQDYAAFADADPHVIPRETSRSQTTRCAQYHGWTRSRFANGSRRRREGFTGCQATTSGAWLRGLAQWKTLVQPRNPSRKKFPEFSRGAKHGLLPHGRETIVIRTRRGFQSTVESRGISNTTGPLLRWSSYPANLNGIYDLGGNVWEYCGICLRRAPTAVPHGEAPVTAIARRSCIHPTANW